MYVGCLIVFAYWFARWSCDVTRSSSRRSFTRVVVRVSCVSLGERERVRARVCVRVRGGMRARMRASSSLSGVGCAFAFSCVLCVWCVTSVSCVRFSFVSYVSGLHLRRRRARVRVLVRVRLGGGVGGGDCVRGTSCC